MKEAESRELRVQVLEECGAGADTLDELLAYGDKPFEARKIHHLQSFPLPDEPHIPSWTAYASDARVSGAFEGLKKRFVQLQFPIRAGMSQHPAHRAATRQGRFGEAAAFAPGLELRLPSELELTVHSSIAGRIPILTAADREDFVALVRAFTERNEPAPVPDSMGACIVTGLNNWDRIASYRRSWEEKQPGLVTEQAWAEEFHRLRAQKELYQDRFILLSRGPYSAVGGGDAGLDEKDWLDRSLVIRREHELTHYFTFRVFGFMRNHLLDELIADGVGLLQAFGHYRADLALRFLGLEAYPAYRGGGRLDVYRGKPPLSDEGFRVLQSLAFRSIDNLKKLLRDRRDLRVDLSGLAKLTFTLATLTLEELASPQMPSRVGQRLA